MKKLIKIYKRQLKLDKYRKRTLDSRPCKPLSICEGFGGGISFAASMALGKKSAIPEYGGCFRFSIGGKYSIGGLGAKRARRFGGK
jgi:hypothetical protein